MNQHTNIEPIKLNQLLEAGKALLIDVREANEFTEEHIPYAISIPLSQIEEALPNLSESTQEIVFQCKLGSRGEIACTATSVQALKNHQIYNLAGGIEKWKELNLPTINSRKYIKISIMRQVQIIVGGLILTSSLIGFSGVITGFTIAGILGGALMVAGITGWCGMAILLSNMPWNRPSSRNNSG